jgi:hypothetical protein
LFSLLVEDISITVPCLPLFTQAKIKTVFSNN